MRRLPDRPSVSEDVRLQYRGVRKFLFGFIILVLLSLGMDRAADSVFLSLEGIYPTAPGVHLAGVNGTRNKKTNKTKHHETC